MSITKRFSKFLDNIKLTDQQVNAGNTSRKSVVSVLNSHYWDLNSETDNSIFVGSWGKFTRIRPPRDVDVLFMLPPSVYNRFEMRTGNRQSQLLQEVKGVLESSFPNTAIKGDGPVVKVPFSSYNVELIPAFKLTSGKYYVCMTDKGGYYKTADYKAESKIIRDSNETSNNKTRHLIRMMKCWQGYCDVPIKSFWIELLVVDFLKTWKHKDKSMHYYDWMVRDFLKYLEGETNSTVYAPGTGEAMNLGNQWLSKASTARRRAEKACENESEDPDTAGEEWQKIFGTDIPKRV